MSDILTARSSLQIHSTIPPFVEFFKRKPSQCCRSEYNGLLLLSPWDEQYQINFAKSICIIFQRCVRCHRQRIFYSGTFDMALYPRLYPPPGSLIKMSKAFSHFTEILWLLGCWHDGNDKQVEGQSAQRNWLYISPGITPPAIILHPMAHHADTALLTA